MFCRIVFSLTMWTIYSVQAIITFRLIKDAEFQLRWQGTQKYPLKIDPIMPNKEMDGGLRDGQ